MLRHWIAAAAALVSATAASATPPNWTGFYVGVNGTGSRDKVDASGTLQIQQISGLFVTGRGIVIVPGTTLPFAASHNETNWGGGGQLGYQWQSGNFVFGAEADYDPFHRNVAVAQSQQLPPTALTPATTIDSVRDVRINGEWSIRARLGVAFGGTLAYATGGYANARGRVTNVDSFTNPGGPAAPCTPACQANLGPEGPVVTTGSAHRNMGGWTGGLGVEQALGAHFSIALEYRHTDLGSKDFTPSGGTVVNTGPETHGNNGGTGSLGQVSPGPTNISLTTDALSLRLNFRF